MDGEDAGDRVWKCAGKSAEFFQRGGADRWLPTDEYNVDNGWSGHRHRVPYSILIRVTHAHGGHES
ncbi:hypothetical protein GCM10009777_39490 [Microbacterium pumilum]|uniref:Uncharacterized protein n=1 Tax=Microbacterium pumilum TaxID=344165 RepID=A0ABN2T4S7_9MICO